MNFLKKHSSVLILILIFIFALFLRTVNLTRYPVGFQIDEASLGYNAYSILLTGKSESGEKFPLYIDTFGDQRPTGYNYFAVPTVLIFGLNEFSTRLPGAIFGALSIFPIFLLSYLFFGNRKAALFSSLLLAISPWSFVLSRASAETVVALFFIMLGFYFIFSFYKSNRNWKLILGTLLLTASFFFYHTPRVFVPMFFLISILVLLWPFKQKLNKKLIKIFVSFLCVSVVSFILVFVVKGGTGRFTQVNIFNFPETTLVLNEQIREDGSDMAPLLQTRIFHNKPVNYSLTFISNYLQYFSGDFLFTGGGLPIWYDVEGAGLILLAELPFILYGVYIAIRTKDRFSKLPLFWILAAPITAALTVDDIPNLQRAIVLFPMIEVIAALGIISFVGLFKKKRSTIAAAVIGIILVFNFTYFLHQYFIHGKTHRTWFRNNGFSELMQNVNQNYNNYDKIVATKTGGGYPLFLFYSKYDPNTYISEGSPKDADYKGFGKYIFVPNECPSINTSVSLPEGTKVLYVDRGTCNEPNLKTGKKFKNIYREDGSLGFRIVY